MLKSSHLLGDIHMLNFLCYLPCITLHTHSYITYSSGGGEYYLLMTYMMLREKLYLKICCSEFIKGRFLKSLLRSLFMTVSLIWPQIGIINYLDTADFFLYLTDHYFLSFFFFTIKTFRCFQIVRWFILFFGNYCFLYSIFSNQFYVTHSF